MKKDKTLLKRIALKVNLRLGWIRSKRILEKLLEEINGDKR